MDRILHRFLIITFLLAANFTNIFAQRGYYDAPYKRYEADAGVLTNGAFVMPKSYAQPDLQSEASNQVCVDMTTLNASVEWTMIEAADGLVLRFCIPKGETDVVGVYVDGVRITGITLASTWSWESLWNNMNPNNNGVSNKNPKKRFDEVRLKLPNKVAVNSKLKLVTESGNVHLDFVEMEPVPAAITAPSGAAVYSGNGSDLQTFINNNGGKIIFLPTGDYSVSVQLQFNAANTTLQGAGMWYSHINFTNASSNNGGLNGNANNISFADLFLTTNNASRSNSYKAINGVFTTGSTIKNVWAEHFECGAWIAQYGSGPAVANGFTMSYCRFRDNYADGTNLCKGTINAIVEHCDYRNNGDDDMAIWSANNQECNNNTFRYNTSENTWRASGVAIYGGKSNQAYNIIVKDNLEAGLRANNAFAGYTFDAAGQHVFHDITLIACGTFNDLYNNPVGAIDLLVTSNCGTQVNNVKFYNIDIIDAKNDGIYFNKTSGDGFYNFIFENITITNTGKEYPYNNATNSSAKRGMFVRFAGSPALKGNGTYCGMNYSGRGGNAIVDEDKSGIGSFAWTAATSCTFISSFTPANAISGSIVTIRGGGFTGATAVTFGGIPAASFTVVSDSIITAVVGNGAFGTITVTTAATTVSKSGFNYMLCSGGINTSLLADITGSSYQWQLNTGSDFITIADGTNYSGSSTSTLLLNNIPSSWYGYQYRCLVNNNTFSNVFTLKFTDTWTGAAGTTAWETGANWSCGSTPDANTDAIINSGTVILNSNTSCRSVSVSNAANCTIASGYKLTLL